MAGHSRETAAAPGDVSDACTLLYIVQHQDMHIIFHTTLNRFVLHRYRGLVGVRGTINTLSKTRFSLFTF